MHHELLFALYLLSWNLNNLQKQLLLQTKADLKVITIKDLLRTLAINLFIISDMILIMLFLKYETGIKILEVI
jgi:hypothetical protein